VDYKTLEHYKSITVHRCVKVLIPGPLLNRMGIITAPEEPVKICVRTINRPVSLKWTPI
jgi:hypothetical protein